MFAIECQNADFLKQIEQCKLLQFLEMIALKEKNSFIEYLAKQDTIKIKNGLRRSGYYFTKVDLSIKENENNTVDLIYDVDLGKKALIQKVRFVGDKIYKDRKLRRVITTEEAKFWKFLSSNKYLNEEKILLDQRLLRNFYLNKGFYQVKVTNSHAQMVDENYFVVTFKSSQIINFLPLEDNAPAISSFPFRFGPTQELFSLQCHCVCVMCCAAACCCTRRFPLSGAKVSVGTSICSFLRCSAPRARHRP